MKTHTRHLLTLAVLLGFTAQTWAQSSAVPNQISYQGIVTDAGGTPIGNTTPENRTVVFRIWDHATSTAVGNLIYSEQQVVTISKGEFSVLVGDGTAVTGTPLGYSEPTGTIPNAFGGSTRFIGVAVYDSGGAVAPEISPRQRVVSSAFAYRAKVAENMNGGTITGAVTATGSTFTGGTFNSGTFTGSVTATGGSFTGTGAGLTTLNASNLSSGTVGDARLSSNVALLNRSPQTFSGAINSFSGNVGIGTTTPRSILDIAPAAGTTNGIRVGKWADTASRYIGITDQTGLTFPTTGGFSGLEFGGPTSAAGGFLAFYTHDLGFGNGERMRIDKLGNVGIGTSTPTQKLEVAGNALVGTGDNSAFVVDAGGFARLGIVKKSGLDPIIAAATGSHIVFGQSNQSSLFTNIGSSTLTEYMRIQNGGNVGIGTTNPISPLHVQKPGDATEIRVGNYAAGGTSVILATSASVSGYGLIQTTKAQGSSFGDLALSPLGGNVGIGTTSPTQGKLVVNGGPSYAFSASFLQVGGGSFTSIGHGAHVVSIYATGGILSNDGLYATSDARIKTIDGISNGAADLDALLGIEITDYHYRDKVAKGDSVQKKVIAQQVEKVCPQAVSYITDVVPDIYQKATFKDGWVELKTDLKKGERVRLTDDKTTNVFEVLEVKKDKFRTAFEPAADQVFVYGREVKDFRIVDYDAISMLNVSATQQIKKEKDAEVKALKDENTELKAKLAAQDTRLATLEAQTQRLADLEAKDKAREAKLAAIEKLLLAADRAAVKPVSLKKSVGGAE